VPPFETVIAKCENVIKLRLTFFHFGPFFSGDPFVFVFNAGISENKTDVLGSPSGVEINQLIVGRHAAKI
jgi:hypothetical protein